MLMAEENLDFIEACNMLYPRYPLSTSSSKGVSWGSFPSLSLARTDGSGIVSNSTTQGSNSPVKNAVNIYLR